MRPCKDEAQKIISYLLESYEKGLKKNANRTVTSDPNSNQVAAKFKNLQKGLGLEVNYLKVFFVSMKALYKFWNFAFQFCFCLIILICWMTLKIAFLGEVPTTKEIGR